MIYNIPQSLIESATSVLLGHLTEGKVDDLKAQNPHMSNEIDAYSNLDSTPTKKFVPWLVSQHKKGNVTPGDSSIKGVLDGFEKYKSKHGIKDHSGMTYDQVKTAVEPHLGTTATKKETEQKQNEEGIERIPHVEIYHIKTKEAAQNVYGGGSKLGGNHANWCVSARGDDNMFGHYGDLYTIHVPHDENSPYAYHPFEGHVTDRHNDPDDKSKMHEMPAEDAIKRNPELHSPIKTIDRMTAEKKKKYRENTKKIYDPNTSSRDIFDAYKFAQENGYKNHIYETILHPNASSELLHHAGTHLEYVPLVTSAIVIHDKIRPETINKMLDSPDVRIRRDAINGNVGNKDNVLKGLHDTDKYVINAALLHPYTSKEDIVNHFNKNQKNMSPEIKNMFQKHINK